MLNIHWRVDTQKNARHYDVNSESQPSRSWYGVWPHVSFPGVLSVFNIVFIITRVATEDDLVDCSLCFEHVQSDHFRLLADQSKSETNEISNEL